jgi:hypothetical protein
VFLTPLLRFPRNLQFTMWPARQLSLSPGSADRQFTALQAERIWLISSHVPQAVELQLYLFERFALAFESGFGSSLASGAS